MGSDPESLIRATFEAVRDITWAEELEPKFKDQGVDTASMKSFREAWNHHADARDWARWREEMKGYSTDRIQDMLMDCVEQLDAIGMLQWQRDKEARERDKLQQILKGSNDKCDKREGSAQAKDRSREV